MQTVCKRYVTNRLHTGLQTVCKFPNPNWNQQIPQKNQLLMHERLHNSLPFKRSILWIKTQLRLEDALNFQLF